MKVLVSGSTGFIGSALVRHLQAEGHEVARLVRPGSAGGEGAAVQWDPDAGQIDSAALAGFDGVVHLAGLSIASGRWNDDLKRRIRESRLKGTKLLAGALAGLESPPKVLVSASAIGFYGDRGAETLTEESAAGKEGFLASFTPDWEAASGPAKEKGVRVVWPRIGFVLGMEGGGFPKMLTPFKMGAGGRIGDGTQIVSWIAIDDLVEVLRFALENEKVEGPVNAVTPNPVSNLEFTKTLGKVLGRPTIFPLPAFMARLVMGEMADEILLASTRVEPARLKELGFEFRHPEIEGALRVILGKVE